ncbi:hypothetical protein [Bacillus sp. EB01]|uniref:hypothetical protein n=1 Tax=Bacillus sp. EB01 TaxID=1347086 RepID=UPI000A79A444|nr:hypothetical protein [Bacillus sp. EB01]
MQAGNQDYDVIGVGGRFLRADSRVVQIGELCFPGGNYFVNGWASFMDGAIESG